MIKTIERLEINELRDKLTAFLNKVGIPGNADVTLNNENDYYTIKIGEYNFIGFYPKENNIIFILLIVNSSKELTNNVKVKYVEAFIFAVKDFVPTRFLIYQYPQSQAFILIDIKGFKKGTIIYENSCCRGGTIRVFKEPVFESEIIDFELLKEL